jgi:SAM-dependent methyltransferase
MLQSATYWERIAETAWGAYISNIEKQAVLEAHRRFEKPGCAAEIGCDGGRWSKLLSDSGWDLTCIDVREQALTICKERIPTARHILVDGARTSLPLSTGSMDLLLCMEVFPVIRSDWFIAESYRVLAGGGVVVGVFLNFLSFRGLFHRAREVFGKTNRGSGLYDRAYFRWKKRLQHTGFRIVQEKGLCWFPLTRSSNSRFVPVFEFFENALALNRIIGLSPWIVFAAEKRK